MNAFNVDFSKYESLKTVNASGNQLTGTVGFSGAKTVTTVDLSGNKIADLSGIRGMDALTTLNLKDNKELTSLDTLLEGITESTKLSLNIAGTVAADKESAIKEFQGKYKDITVTYTSDTSKD